MNSLVFFSYLSTSSHNLTDGDDELIHVVLCVVESKSGTNTHFVPQGAKGRLGAVVTGTHGYALFIQQRSRLRYGDAIKVERNDTDAVLGIAYEMQAWHLCKLFAGILRQLMFMMLDAREVRCGSHNQGPHQVRWHRPRWVCRPRNGQVARCTPCAPTSHP